MAMTPEQEQLLVDKYSTTNPLGQVMQVAKHLPQDQAAKILRYATATGDAPALVANNLHAYETDIIDKIDWDSVLQQSPKTYEFLNNPLHMAAVRERQNIDSLAAVENEWKWWTAAKNGIKAIPQALLSLGQGLVESSVYSSLKNGVPFAGEQVIGADTAFGAAGPPADDTPPVKSAEGYQPEPALDRLTHPDILKRKEVRADSKIGQLGLDIVETAPQIAAQIAVALATGGTGAMLFMGAQIAGGEYEKLRKDGVAPDRAFTGAVLDAAAQAPLERIGLARIMKAFPAQSPPAKKVKEIMQAGLTEGLTEWVQQYPEAAAEIWARHPEYSADQRGAQFLQDFAEITKEGLYQGAVAAPFGFLGGAVKISLQKKLTEAYVEQREQQQALIAASPLLHISPETVEQHLDAVTEGEKVYIDPEALTLFQEGNPEIVEELGVSEQEIQDALKIGAMVEVPVSKYDVVAAKHPEVQQALKDDIADDEEGMTQRRLSERDQQDIARAQDEGKRQRSEVQAASRDVYENMRAAGIGADQARTALTALVSNARIMSDNPAQWLREKAPLFQQIRNDQKPGFLKKVKGMLQGGAPQYNWVQTKVKLPEQVQSVTADSQAFKDIPDKAAWQKAARSYAQQHFQGKTFVNQHTGWKIGIFREGLKHTMHHAGTKVHNLSMTVLDKLIENSVYVRSEADTKGKPDIKAWHYFYAPLAVGNKSYVVKLVVKETPNGQKFYDHGAVENERSGRAPLGGAPGGALRHQAFTGSSTLSINDLLEDINNARSIDPLFQNERGMIHWNNEGRAIITLFEDADASTLIHEMVGHYFTQNLMEQGAREDAPDWMRKDRQTMLDYAGIENWDTASVEQRTAAHEKWAKAAESYIMEGKAPSLETRPLFKKFKDWLTGIYRTIKNIGVDVNPAVAEVFNRMLATEEEISQLEYAEGYHQRMPAEVLTALTPAQESQLDRLIVRAKEAAENKLRAEVMQSITEENRAKMAAEKQVTTTRFTNEVSQEPFYAAADQVSADFKRDARHVARSYQNGKLPEDQAVHFEYLAASYEFTSGDELAAKILQQPTKAQEIARRVQQHMRQFRDLLTDPAALRQAAQEAMYSDEGAMLLAAEQQVLQEQLGKVLDAEQKRKEVRRLQEEARLAAEWTMQSKSIENAVKYQSYMASERRASEKYGQALAKKDVETALEWKKIQLFNHNMVMQSFSVRRESERVNRYFKRQRKADRKTWGSEPHFVQAADLLNRLGFSRKDYNPALKEESLLAYYRRMEAENPDMAAISDWVIANSQQESQLDPRKLTLDQLKDMENALRNIKTLGKLGVSSDSFVVINGGASVSETSAALVLAANKNAKDVLVDQPERAAKGTVGQLIADFKAGLIKPSQYFLRLDGMKSFGLWDRVMYHFMNTAQNYESRLMGKVTQALEDAFLSEGMNKEQRYQDANKKMYIREWDVSVTRQYLRTIVLNMGSRSNKDRLFSKAPVGFPQSVVWKDANWTEEEVSQVLTQYLDARDFRLVNKIWKAINLYDEYNTMIKRMTGFTLGKVEAVPVSFTLPTGELIYLDGGYYPLKQDSRASKQAEMNAEKALSDDYVGVMPYPNSGASKARTTNARYSVDLEFGNIYQHIKDISHDIAFRPVMHDINKIMRKDEIKNVLRRKLGDEGYRAILSWQKAVASSHDTAEERGWFDGIANALRQRAVVANLLLRPATITQNAANFTLYGDAVNGFSDKDAFAAYMKHGWSQYIPSALGGNLQKARELREYVYSKSAMMKDKMENPDFSLRELHGLGMQDNKLMRMENAAAQDAGIKIALTQEKVLNFASDLLAWADQMTDIPLWLGAYEKAIQALRLSEAEAVRYADTVIERSTGTGRRIDTSKMQRGSATERLFSMFMTFLNTQYNRWAMEYDIFLREKDVMRLMKFVGIRYLAFGALSALASFKTPDDDEDVFVWFVKNVLEWPLGLIPVGGGAIKYAFDTAVGFRSFSYGLTPVERNIEDLFKIIGTVKSEKKTGAEKAEAATTAAAFLFKYPDQLNDWFWNAYDIYFNGMNPESRDLIRRRPRKER